MDKLTERAALRQRIHECTDPLGYVTMVVDGGPGFRRTKQYRNPGCIQIERDAEFEQVWAGAPVQVYLEGPSE